MPHPARFAGALLAIGATLLGVGYWIEGKAWLAQRLLERSWIAHLEDGRAHPPWPWAGKFAQAAGQTGRPGLRTDPPGQPLWSNSL